MASLRLSTGGRDIIVAADRVLVVGRDPDADVRAEDTRVSRRHLEVRFEGSSWVAEDLGSSNGTYVDGRRVTRVVVASPVRLLLGGPHDGLAVDLTPSPSPAATPGGVEGPGAAPSPATAAAPAAQPVSGAPPALQITAGGRDFTLSGTDGLVIGRDPAAGLQLTDTRVSRHHVAVRLGPGGWYVEDVGSTNGTFSEGRRIGRLDLSGPTRILLGDADAGVPVELTPVLGVAGAGRPLVIPGAAAAPPPPGPPDALAAAPPRAAVGRLAAIHRPAPGRAVRIGRSADNEIVITDLLVSRHHAELRLDLARGYELVDLGSHNGTFVNGQRVSSALLRENDIVAVGRHVFRLREGGLEEYVDTGEVTFEVANLMVRAPGDHNRVLLDDVSFALDTCSFLAVVGTSGAGKSTLLNALTGFRPADSGTVLYGGRDLYAAYDEMRQRIGYVPQEDILHTQLTVRRALRYAAELRFPSDVPAMERERRVEEVMSELGLTERAELQIGKLSGGQRKRTSVALELLTKPSLLFLDEPTSGLDPGYEKELMKLLRQLADGGRTVIVVTHSLQSLSLCDRVIFLAPGGKTAFFGPPAEALPYFGREDFADVFSDLEQHRSFDWKQRFRSSPAYAQFVHRPLAEGQVGRVRPPEQAQVARRTQSWGRQYSTLLRRYVAVMVSDRGNLLILIAQAPIAAMLILLAISPNGFDPANPGAAATAQQAIPFLVIVATLFGAFNAIREIVKELAIYRRERSVGLSISAYLASKVTVQVAIALLESVILVVIAVRRQGGPPDAAVLGSPDVELVADVFLTMIAAMGLGLLISSVARSPDRALTLLPVLMVPQILLAFPELHADDKPVLAQLGYVTSATWGFDAAASTVHLNQLIYNGPSARDPSTFPPGAEGDNADKNAITDIRDRWDHNPATWVTAAGALVIITTVELGATAYVLRRRDPSLLGSPVRRPAGGYAAPPAASGR